jgi:hypothetical protein
MQRCGKHASSAIEAVFSAWSLLGVTLKTIGDIKYLGVIFDKKIRWIPHIEMIETNAFRTYIRVYSLFENERLRTNIKLTLHKALIRSVMTYACPAWKFAADTHIIKLQLLQNNFPRRTPVREMHMTFHLPYVHDYMTKLCRQQTAVVLDHNNENVRYIGQGEGRHRK